MKDPAHNLAIKSLYLQIKECGKSSTPSLISGKTDRSKFSKAKEAQGDSSIEEEDENDRNSLTETISMVS